MGGPGVEQYYTPLDVLLQGYLDDYFSGEKYVEAAEWLLKNGHSARQFRWDEGSAASSVLTPSLADQAFNGKRCRLPSRYLFGDQVPYQHGTRVAI